MATMQWASKEGGRDKRVGKRGQCVVTMQWVSVMGRAHARRPRTAFFSLLSTLYSEVMSQDDSVSQASR